MRSEFDFLLCEYFNNQGALVDRLFVVDSEADDDTEVEKTRRALKSDKGAALLKAMKAGADAEGTRTSVAEGTIAVQALIYEVASERMPITEARDVTSVSVNYQKAVAISDVMTVLEATQGGDAASWARAIFSPLRLGPAGVH